MTLLCSLIFCFCWVHLHHLGAPTSPWGVCTCSRVSAPMGCSWGAVMSTKWAVAGWQHDGVTDGQYLGDAMMSN